MSLAGEAGERPEAEAVRLGPLGVATAVGLSLLVVLAILFWEGRDVLWLDESWTGAIAGQTGLAATARQIYWDVNAPLYYWLVHGWTRLFGLSDWALRTPSLLAAAATPLVAALAPTPGLTRGQRLCWAAVLAFWFPALCYGAEARCYALLLLVATGQTAAFVRLMRRPERRDRAALWAALAALAILVHYDALYLGAAQGGLYLLRHPRRALANWPAALLFLPAFGWLAYHGPRISLFTHSGIAWYSRLGARDLPFIGNYLADGGDRIAPWLLGVMASALTLRLAPPWEEAPARPEASKPLQLAIAGSLLAMAATVGIGFLKPSFTFRYLTPCEPGLLLGLVWLVRLLAGRRASGPLIALALVYTGVTSWMLADGLRMAPRRYNFENASRALAAGHPRRLVFLWDHPVDPILHPEQLAALGGFFFQRAGEPVVVDAVVLRPGEDPNSRLLDDARAPGSAILWLYDRAVVGTTARSHPPRLTTLRPELKCRDVGNRRFGVIACPAGDGVEPAPSPERPHQAG